MQQFPDVQALDVQCDVEQVTEAQDKQVQLSASEERLLEQNPEATTAEKETGTRSGKQPVFTEYKAAILPERVTFKAGVTYVDSEGIIYAQEEKEGEYCGGVFPSSRLWLISHY